MLIRGIKGSHDGGVAILDGNRLVFSIEVEKLDNGRRYSELGDLTRVAEVFDPGATDPYMLFEHRVRPQWIDRVPSIVHLDGSARLQTIEPSTPNTRAGRILAEYERLSGIPVLCNTSANLNGHGFFSDAGTAMRWGRTRYVYSGGRLYTDPSAAAGDDRGAGARPRSPGGGPADATWRR